MRLGDALGKSEFSRRDIKIICVATPYEEFGIWLLKANHYEVRDTDGNGTIDEEATRARLCRRGY